MTRGSDIRYTLVLKNIDLKEIGEVYATIEQDRGSRTGDDIEVTKYGKVTYDASGIPTEDENNQVHFDFDENAVEFDLDQKDTLMFESGTAEVQLRMISVYGTIIGTLTNRIRVNPVLYTKVL